jgi:MFS transporter, AAHS family, 4-hydroxybenzoate transporter
MTYSDLQSRFKNLIDNQPMSTYQIIIVAMCFVLNMNDGIDVLIVSFSDSDIMSEWHLTNTEFGFVASAGLAGMTVGAFFLAPLGDKIGRRKVFIVSLSLITSGMLLVFFCTAYWQLLTLRFLTGLGIGGILPTMAATASEFSNNKNRDFNVALVQAGWPVGAILTGFFCAYAIPIFGWRFVFLFAGCVSLAMLVGVVIYMTDSLEFLIKKQPTNALVKINNLLSKMGQVGIDSLPPKPSQQTTTPINALFTTAYRDSTFKLWTGVFFGFLTLYTLLSWIKTIAKATGLSDSMATYVGVSLNVGAAIGTAFMGVVAGKLGLKKTVPLFMIIAAVVMLVYGNVALSTVMIFVVIFLIGVFVQGGFNGMYPTISRVYPAEIRTTGVGFAIGIGRFGAILGPIVFGVLKDKNLSISLIFSLLALPLLVTGFCVSRLKSKNLEE